MNFTCRQRCGDAAAADAVGARDGSRAGGLGAASPTRAGQAQDQSAAARFAVALRQALPRPRARRARRAGRRGADHADRADRGAAHDRFRLHRARRRADRQLLSGDDRRRGAARAGERIALLPRHHARRAHRRRFARRRVRASHLALRRLFRRGQDRRGDLAAHRRHHADQGRGRLFGLGRACAISCCSSAPAP